jgi:6-phosphogluconate dehydrogenase
MMPGGSPEAYQYIQDIVEKVAAQVDDGPCAMYIGDGGAGNFVKMVHNGIEYGDMQLISGRYARWVLYAVPSFCLPIT